MNSPIHQQTLGHAQVRVFPSNAAVGAAAAEEAARSLLRSLARRNAARIVVATGNSQLDTVDALGRWDGIDWSKVEVFHMDEYVGLPGDHPSSFRRWVKEKLADIVHPGEVHYINGDCGDCEAECARYGRLLMSAPIDVCLLGIGENGHLAFNDPHVADFDDPLVMKPVTLDLACRRQQVGEGHFKNLDEVPRRALTLTIPALMRSEHVICSVPERRKAEAVRNAIHGPLTSQCPASRLLTHPRMSIYLDVESASLTRRDNSFGLRDFPQRVGE